MKNPKLRLRALLIFMLLMPALALAVDTDGDGSPDDWEAIWGSDPNVFDTDTDADGVPDDIEINTYGTNPANPDTDGDSQPDGEEIAVYGSDPLTAEILVKYYCYQKHGISGYASLSASDVTDYYCLWLDENQSPLYVGETYKFFQAPANEITLPANVDDDGDGDPDSYLTITYTRRNIPALQSASTNLPWVSAMGSSNTLVVSNLQPDNRVVSFFPPGEETIGYSSYPCGICYERLTVHGLQIAVTLDPSGDLDSDSLTNDVDPDDDNDGVPDAEDLFPWNAAETTDNDNDGIGDNADTNDDSDSHLDVDDNCPLIANEDQSDIDEDGLGDACDDDSDNDGTPDASDAFPLNPNETGDADNDGIGDNADDDADNDLIPDVDDPNPGVPNTNLGLGWLTTCFQQPAQSAFCSGDLSYGQGAVPGFTNLKQLDAGLWHACGLDDNGVDCWGEADRTYVSSMTKVAKISTSKNFSCAIADSKIKCWGTEKPSSSTGIYAVNYVQDISVGHSHVCAVYDNQVGCWGFGGNINGEETVPALVNPTKVAAGGSFSCALHNGGEIACWGDNALLLPPAGAGWKAISAGNRHACAIASDNQVSCWGVNGYGQLNAPAGSAMRLSMGFQHSCAVMTDDSIKCWGRNNEGQIDVGLDADLDGQNNFLDSDDDNDGIPDDWEAVWGSDPFVVDTDTDADGVPDAVETGVYGTNPTNPDSDADGIADGEEIAVYGFNPLVAESDFDGDGLIDVWDDDADNDGSPKTEELFAGSSDLDPAMRPYWWRTFNGDSADDYFGHSVSDAGDVNADGYADLIVGAYGDGDNGYNSGSARVLSGVDGSVLYTFNGDSSSDYFGFSVSGAGDVNGDGYADLIVGAHRDSNSAVHSGSASVFSGLDGSTLYTFNGDDASDYFGYSVSGAGDVNADGYDDLLIGAVSDDNNGYLSGSARVFSGIDGSVLYTFNGDSANESFGASVSEAGDVNSDGYADLIVGAPYDDNNGSHSGSARVFSGVDGSVLYTFNGDSSSDYFGFSVSGAGDVNGDGYADLIVGADMDDNNGSNSGSARVFNGIDGSVLYTFYGDSGDDNFGRSVSGAGDINGDGYADLIVGAYRDDNNGSSSGSARVFSGIDGSVIYTFNGDSAVDYFGTSVSHAGDLDGDGYADLIVGARYDDNNGFSSGSARVFLAKDLFNDSDLDFIVNSADVDSDNDGVPDASDAFPYDASESQDSDGDGIGDNADQCDSTASLNSDNDGDGCDDATEDTDDDNDGIPDSWEAILGTNPLLADTDSDSDGVPDALESGVYGTNPANADTDGDSINDGDEIVLYGSNPLVADTDNDNDGIPDLVDTDDDNDGVLDASDAFPLDAGESQDSDADGLGDNADQCDSTISLDSDNDADGCDDATEDADDDNDGVLDVSDAFPLDASESLDSDGDGMGNNADQCDSTVSLDSDNDADGCDDATEDTDDDNDGYLDTDELSCGSDPLDALSVCPSPLDTDGDGTPDYLDDDDDGDGILDSFEAVIGSDPLVPNTDSDHDLIPNYYETNFYGTNPFNDDTDGDGFHDGREILVFGTDPLVADSDNDSDDIPDLADDDDDNDGAPDTSDAFPLDASESQDTDADGLGDNADQCDSTPSLDSDYDGDGCDDATEDLDDDNDGIADVDEAGYGTNPLNADTDGDGIDDAIEIAAGLNPLVAEAPSNPDDFDSDGSIAYEEGLAGLSDFNPLERPYWWRTINAPGFAVRAVGDLDGDGYSDFIIGRYQENSANGSESGVVRAFNGKTAVLIDTFLGNSAYDFFGGSIDSAGDVNADGYDDIIVGAIGEGGGSARILSGKDGAVLYTKYGTGQFGRSVAGLGDVNSDGYSDFAVGSLGEDTAGTGFGSLTVFSGANGSTLYKKYGTAANKWFGSVISNAGDVNADGVNDLAVVAANGTSRALFVLNGIDGGALYTFYPPLIAREESALAYADVNGDGYSDVILGDSDENAYSGSVRVYSGQDGALLYTLDGDAAYDRFGYAVSSVGDLNGDGYEDFAVGAFGDDNNFENSGSLTVFSGKDAAVLYEINGGPADVYFGRTVSGGRDFDGDGVADFIVGAAQLYDGNGQSSGNARVFLAADLFNDPDLDFIVNVYDSDDDNDGIPDVSDAFPLDASETTDTDSDGIGNNADLDDDNDGIPDTDEIACGSDPLDAGSVCNTTPSTGESDFDADLDDDVLLRSASTSSWRLFSFASGAVTANSGYAAYANSGWVFVANLDADGDLDKDVLLRNTSTGDWRLFTTQNGAVIANSALSLFTPANHSFAAALDVDADGDEDILLRNSSDGSYRLFTVQNGTVSGNAGFGLWAASNWNLVAVGDFDGDADDDILLRNSTDGKYRLFTVEAGGVTGNTAMNIYASADYTVQVASDFDGDGDDDILTRNTSTGVWNLFTVQNGAVSSVTGIYPYQSLDWTFQTEGDFDGDGDSDLLLRNSAGIWKLFTVDSGAVTGNSPVGLYSSTDWQIQH